MNTASDAQLQVFLARQPIYDVGKNVFGYELLYRRGDEDMAGKLSAAESARSLTNALVEIGLNELVASSRAFVNVTGEMIVSGALRAFPPNRVVLEILETVRPTAEIVGAIKALVQAGYSIALDDFLENDNTDPLLDFAEYVKLDITQYETDDLKRTVERLLARGHTVLAERVETHDEHANCRRLGCKLFQGYYMSKPQLVSGTALKSNHLALVKLLSRMNAPDLTLDEVEAIVASDLHLNVQILKFVKSAYFGLPSKVDSIRKALLFVGINTLAAIATLLMMARLSNKPGELVFTAMVRAKMAQSLGLRHSIDAEQHFTVGMLSVLDVLLDMPMSDLLKQLPLSEEIEAALLNPTGPGELAGVLRAVLAYEMGEFDAVSAEGIPIDVASDAYRRALGWATQTQTRLAA